MRRTLTDGGPGTEFWEVFEGFTRSAWRFEQQRAYFIGYEHQQFDDFLAGHPQPPTDNPDLGAWMRQVAQQTSEGKTVGRVRIVDEPITDYQRWMRWMDRWNREAGETIDYLTRRRAHEVGLLPAAGEQDWWLLDDERLVLMFFDDKGFRVRVELLVDEPEVAEARRFRDLAIRAAREKGNATT
jgi:hypothetical protein